MVTSFWATVAGNEKAIETAIRLVAERDYQILLGSFGENGSDNEALETVRQYIPEIEVKPSEPGVFYTYTKEEQGGGFVGAVLRGTTCGGRKIDVCWVNGRPVEVRVDFDGNSACFASQLMGIFEQLGCSGEATTSSLHHMPLKDGIKRCQTLRLTEWPNDEEAMWIYSRDIEVPADMPLTAAQAEKLFGQKNRVRIV